MLLTADVLHPHFFFQAVAGGIEVVLRRPVGVLVGRHWDQTGRFTVAQVFPLPPVFQSSQTVIRFGINSLTVVRLLTIAELLFVCVISPITYCFQIHTQE